MKIGKFETVNDIFLAPMAGFSEFAFRSLCKEFGAGLTCTEMVSAKGLCFDSKHTRELLITLDNESPKMVQIFGNEPEYMVKAIQSDLLKKFDIININMGCPAPKIYKNFEGSSLMANLPLAQTIIKACVQATDKPITIKIRKGIDDDSINAVEFAQMCEKAGASALIIHGRTRKQFYSGNVDYDIIKQVVQSVKIPVIGNGDIVDEASYKKMLDTGCDAVMIGRGAVGNPWIFSKLLKNEYEINKLKVLKKHINILCDKMDERKAIINFRKSLVKYLKNEKITVEQRLKLLSIESKDLLLDEIDKLF